MALTIYDVNQWLDENKKFFVPPICNKLMYKDGQLKTFFVGGPNSRKDFHLEEGEEFFYMLKGDMHLVVFEQGKFRDINIKEGEVFLLPARIPHSPQRIADTIGLVIERERLPNEKDCLRYYVENSEEILYEKWFFCESLEELGPLIKEYFDSEQYKTQKPIPGTILEDKPLKQDFERKLESPFLLNTWLRENDDAIETEGKKLLFDSDYVSRIYVLGNGSHIPDVDLPETFLWQIKGTSTISMNGEVYELGENKTALIGKGEQKSNLPEGIRYLFGCRDSSTQFRLELNGGDTYRDHTLISLPPISRKDFQTHTFNVPAHWVNKRTVRQSRDTTPIFRVQSSNSTVGLWLAVQKSVD